MTTTELKKGCRAFVKNEKRDVLYNTASYLVKTFWNDPKQKSNGLGVLLFSWNHAFYRYGLFDFTSLEKFLRKNKDKIKQEI